MELSVTVTLPQVIRFRDLRDAGVVRNKVTLARWQNDPNIAFPRGRLLGPNTRVWSSEEIQYFGSQAGLPCWNQRPPPRRRRCGEMGARRGIFRDRWITNRGERVKVFVYDYVDLNGKRHEPYFYSVKERLVAAKKIDDELFHKRHTAPSSRTLNDAIDGWLAEDRGLTNCTQDNYRSALRYVRPTIGDLKLEQIDTLKIKELCIAPLGHMRSTQVRVASIVKCVLDWAVEHDWLTLNPLTRKRLRLAAPESKSPKPTPEDIRLLFWLAEQPKQPHSNRVYVWEMFHAIVKMAYYAAMGQAELSGLVWENVDWVEGVIHIKHNFSRYDRLHKTKNKYRLRDAVMWPEIRAVLTVLWERQGRPTEGPVFRTQHGKPVVGMGATYYARMMVALGITRVNEEGRVVPKYGIHGIRALGINAYLNSTKDWFKAARFAGHSSPKMILKHYGYSLDEGEAQQRALAGMTQLVQLPTPSAATEAEIVPCDTVATEVEKRAKKRA